MNTNRHVFKVEDAYGVHFAKYIVHTKVPLLFLNVSFIYVILILIAFILILFILIN